MPFPNLEGKHAGQPYVTARRLLDYQQSRGNPRAAAPRAVLLTWQTRLEDRVRERPEHLQTQGAGTGSVRLRLTPDLGLARLPIGAPAAAHGPSWTTDAPYRETAEELARYRAEGILTVEMEASCLFTVTRAAGVAAAAAFVVSDVLHGERWEPAFGSADVAEGLWTLFEAAGECLSD